MIAIGIDIGFIFNKGVLEAVAGVGALIGARAKLNFNIFGLLGGDQSLWEKEVML